MSDLKPLRMADLPRHIYRCADDKPVKVSTKPIDPNSYTQRLIRLELGGVLTIPISSTGLISRVAKRNNMSFTTKRTDGGRNLRVERIK